MHVDESNSLVVRIVRINLTKSCINENITLNKDLWYHTAFTYSSSDGYVNIYLNGNNITRCYIGSPIDYIGGCKSVRLGARSYIENTCTDIGRFNGTID